MKKIVILLCAVILPVAIVHAEEPVEIFCHGTVGGKFTDSLRIRQNNLERERAEVFSSFDGTLGRASNAGTFAREQGTFSRVGNFVFVNKVSTAGKLSVVVDLDSKMAVAKGLINYADMDETGFDQDEITLWKGRLTDAQNQDLPVAFVCE